MANDTAWHHPMHLHGHAFRVLSRNGKPTRFREWQDTVLLAPRERVEIAFVPDNPGDWMFHCHILEHQAAGMMSLIRIAGPQPPLKGDHHAHDANHRAFARSHGSGDHPPRARAALPQSAARSP